jgi:SP family facilitated glucose transporter-like MFS transporter 8
MQAAERSNHPGCAVTSVAVAALGPIVFGMSLGFTSPATNSMINGPDGLAVLKDSESDIFGAAINIGCVVGAMVGGTVADMFGRRGGILVVMPICALAWVVTATGHSLFPLMVGRLLSGVGTGAVSVVVPIYIAETAPTRLRGTLGACNQLAVTIGILVVYMLGGYAFRTADGEYCDWRTLAFSFVAPIACLFVFAFLIPETPRWYINRGDVDRARNSLRRLRRVESGQTMLASGAAAEEAQQQPSLFSQEMRGKLWDCRRAMRLSIFLCVAQQFSGINAVIFYQTPILKDANISWYETAAVLTMVTQVIMTWVSCILVDRLGRRPLFIMSMTGMAFSAFAVGLYFMLQSPGEPATAVWLLLAGSYCYIASFAIGAGPIPWLMMAELFPNDVRGKACMIATAVNWLCSFIVTCTVKALKDVLEYQGLFWLYAGVCAASAVVASFLVQETKGKSLDEVTMMLQSPTGSAPLLGRHLSPIPSPVSKDSTGEDM